MNNQAEAVFRVRADATNPGQFFACCGLVELAERVCESNMLCWFGNGAFSVSNVDGMPGPESFEDLIGRIAGLPLTQLDREDGAASPLHISIGGGLRLDWWRDSGLGKALKTWAGSQNGARIALAMQKAILGLDAEACLNFSTVVYDPAQPTNKVEPFYFDARRGARPFSRDIGFAPDALQMTTPAYPAVEFLCLVGLQRCRPKPAGEARMFDYYTWQVPLPTSVLQTAVCGLLPAVGARGYRFENAFRTDQRKHKAFSPAIQLWRMPT